jgi:hypothetical protein
MRKIMMTLAAIVVAFAAGTMSATGAVARNAAAEAFWKCASGYAFATNGNAVHCKKVAYIDKKPLGKCPIGLHAYVDRIGDKDMCSVTNAVIGEIGMERGCVSTDLVLGYTKRIVAGADYCGKPIPAEIKPPSVAVSLTV